MVILPIELVSYYFNDKAREATATTGGKNEQSAGQVVDSYFFRLNV